MGCLLQRNRRCSSSSSSSVVHFPLFLVSFLAILLEKSEGVGSSLDKEASSLTLVNIQKYLSKINKPPVISIESPDGDIIDCIDQWKQPAFDHPLLKNHKLQLVPTEMPRWKNEEKVEISGKSGGWGEQVWHQNGTRCPKGTVPIKRITVDDVLRAKSLHHFGRKQPTTALARHIAVSPENFTNNGHEFVTVTSEPVKDVFGAIAGIDAWHPSLGSADEMSTSQIWVLAGSSLDGSDLNSIEAGWMVNERLFGDRRTKLFGYWTADGYNSTGCYNVVCPGFVQMNSDIVLGGNINNVSTIAGTQYGNTFYVWKDPNTKNWWLGTGPANKQAAVGYWPTELFTYFKEHATRVEWGGEVINTKPNGAHTSTQMGSGRFAQEGLGNASLFRNLGIVDSFNHFSPPIITSKRVDNSNCYNLSVIFTSDDLGTHFFYGGPGLNPNCP